MPWNSACIMKALDSYSAMELCMCIMKALDSYSAMELCMYNEGFGLIQCHGTLHV